MKPTKRHALCAALALGLLAGTGLSHAQSAMDNIQKTKLIKIAIPTDFPPYGFVGVDLKPQGLDCDLANYNAVTTILTEDVGVAAGDGFKLLGRAQGSQAKGCSIAVDQFLKATQP